MEQNYRCTQPLLEATNRVIAEAKERHAKDLWSRRAGGGPPTLVTCQDEDEQTEFLIRRILEHREGGLLLHRQAVLFRASHHSLSLEVELGRRNIPYHKYGGLKFVEMAHIKDLMAFLRLAENPRDLMAGTRVLLLLPGIGPKKAKALMGELLTAGGDFGPWRAARPPAAAAAVWPGFVDMMAALAGPSAPPLPAQIHLIRTFYRPLLEQAQDNAQARLQDLEQLEQISARFPDRAHFLAELVLDPPSYTGDLAGDPLLDEDYLILSTMHSAKGLEWDAVYVIHAADGNIPSDMATGDSDEIEEERRLFYVALTRARDWLYVCVPLRYYTAGRRLHDRHGYAQPSRFLTGKAAPWFQLEQAVESGPEPGAPADSAAQAAESIRADIRALWE